MEEKISNLINKYKQIRKKLKTLYYMMNVVYFDAATIAPPKSYMERGEHLSSLSEQAYNIKTSDEFVSLVEELYENKQSLDEDFAHEIELLKEEIDQAKKIPLEEMLDYEKTLNEAQIKWEEAKHKDDYSIFEPYLEKIVAYKKKEVKYLETEDLKGYDVLLNMFERGYTQKEYDEFFNKIKSDLVPFVKKVCSLKNEDYSFATDFYEKEKQIKIAKYMGDVLCFDFDRGSMAESEHPFTWNTDSNNVRITNHFYENDFSNSLFSAIHEFGHALYEQNIDEKYNDTFIGGGVSMAMHESQSRFYENVIGRNYQFWEVHFTKLKEIYKTQLENVSLDDFYKMINKVESSLIRTEADELTYPLHVMLRYELEKQLIDGSLEVKDLEEAWNLKIKEYFGIEVPCSSKGVLQDSHWSGGSIGYFPTYALGSAISSQLLFKMNQEFDVFDSLKEGNTKKINDWLKNHIHQYGSSKYPKQILENALGEEFNAKYYIDYLIKKYSKIYNL